MEELGVKTAVSKVDGPFIEASASSEVRNVRSSETFTYIHRRQVPVNNRNTRTKCEICSKLTTKTAERRQWQHSDAFIVNFEHISHLFLVFLLLTLSM